MDARRQDFFTSIGLLILRVGIGLYLMTHGWGKLQKLLHGEGDKFADPLGIGPTLSQFLAMSAEFFCALLIVIGLATRLATVPIIATMVVAILTVHGQDPWTSGAGRSKEPAMLYLIPFFALIFTGAGRFSIDGLIWPWWRRRRAERKAAPL
jgi:putative oxidoreductase